MEETTLKTWKYSISAAEKAPSTAPLPLTGKLEDVLCQAAELGYSAVEFHSRENARFDLQAIQRAKERHGVAVSALVTGRLFTQGKCSLLDDAAYACDRAMEGMRQYIRLASELETDIVIGWVKGNVPAGGDREEYMQRLAGSLQELNELAGERRVRIFLEVINRYETNIFNTAAETAEFIRANKLSHCYVHLDTFHMGIEECDPMGAIRSCGDRLGYFHVADNTRLCPGTGQIDFRKILAGLADLRYQGYVNVECLPFADRVQTAVQALECLRASEPREAAC